MKQTKMTHQRPTGFYKTPKPRVQPKSGSWLNHQTHGTTVVVGKKTTRKAKHMLLLRKKAK